MYKYIDTNSGMCDKRCQFGTYKTRMQTQYMPIICRQSACVALNCHNPIVGFSPMVNNKLTSLMLPACELELHPATVTVYVTSHVVPLSCVLRTFAWFVTRPPTGRRRE